MSMRKTKKNLKKKTAEQKAAQKKAAVQTAAPKAADNKSTYSETDAKKAAVLGTEKKSGNSIFAAVACAALVLGLIYYFIPVNGQETVAQSLPVSPVSETSATQVTYPASLFDDGKARHFQYQSGNLTIKYFILKSSDGVIRAAYDACDVCWPAGKGYYQDGDEMVCRNCGRRFASVLINEVQGGCNPAPLKRSIENGQVVIQVNDILDGKQYFNFRKA